MMPPSLTLPIVTALEGDVSVRNGGPRGSGWTAVWRHHSVSRRLRRGLRAGCAPVPRAVHRHGAQRGGELGPAGRPTGGPRRLRARRPAPGDPTPPPVGCAGGAGSSLSARSTAPPPSPSPWATCSRPPTPGHVIKSTDPVWAFGAVLGKALGDPPARASAWCQSWWPCTRRPGDG